MNYGLLGQIAVGIWIIGFALSLLLLAYADWSEGRYERAHEEALRMDFEFDCQRMADRQRKLLKLSEGFAALPEHEQQRLQRAAEMAGFFQTDDEKIAS